MMAVDSESVRRALERSADPAIGRAALTRLIEAHPHLGEEFADDSEFLDAIVAVSVASHSLLAVLERDADAHEMLRASSLHTSATTDGYVFEAASLHDQTDPAAALRRWKHRQVMRIAGRDLLGISDLRTVGRELAGLAQ